MLRRISYRTAIFTFLVALLWLLLGAIALWSPIPRALDIAWEFFGAWVILFFLIVAAGGALLTIAAINGLVARKPAPAAAAPAAPAWPPTVANQRARTGARR
jgi:hypothetical protein